MARSSVVAVVSFWLARGGVFGLLMSKSVLIRSRACLPRRACVRRGSFSSDGGAKQSHRVVLLHKLDLEFARLG
jgi:hypothetical protein